MTDKKGIPEEVPVPASSDASQQGSERTITEEDIRQLMDGERSFQDFFDLSDDVLLVWANQGYFFYNQGKYEEAETIFKGLVTLNDKIAYYHTALGSIYEAQEKYDEALAAFEDALKLDERDICAIVNRGEIRLRQGQILEAAEDFQKGITYDEENIEKAKAAGEQNPLSDPAAQRARALAVVTYEVLKEIEVKVKEAQERGEFPTEPPADLA